MRAYALEFIKVRRRLIGWMVLAVIAVQMLWMTWTFSRMDAEDLLQGWKITLFQLPLLNSIILPLLAAVVASRISDIEHKGHTLCLLETIMPAGRLFDAKFFCGAFYILLALVLQLVIIIPLGIVKGFPVSLPLDRIVLYFLASAAVTLTILALQQVLSLLFPNQMIALSVGVTGSFLALFCLFFPPQVENLILWGYYGVLMVVRMDWIMAEEIVNYYWEPFNLAGFGVLMVIFLVIYLVGRQLFVAKEQ